MREVYEKWEKMKSSGEIGKDEISEIEYLKSEIRKGIEQKSNDIANLVKALIDKMREQINSKKPPNVEKLIYIDEEESEEDEIPEIINRIMVEVPEDSEGQNK